jgi:hypothetical protein
MSPHEAIVALLLKRGWVLWQDEFERLMLAEGWWRMNSGGLPHAEEWDRFRSGVTPAEYIEEIRGMPCVAMAS